MKLWRLLKPETYNAFMNMAVDEAILNSRIQEVVPNTLRLYRWRPSAVSIGKFQNIENEVQISNCEKHGVNIVRRITGGGTVYHDAEDEITYSIIVHRKDLEAKDITDVYAKVYTGLAEALRILGIKADFNEGNEKACPNLTIKGKKVSGSAQSHKKDVVLQHGTLLLDVNLEKMFTFLRVPWASTCIEVAKIAESKITSIRSELGRRVTIEEAYDALSEGFSSALNVRLERDELKPYEVQLAEKLCKEKYSTREWDFHGKSVL
jgi:lipoate-protein ligase A